MDLEYEEEISRLHEILQQSVNKNKKLQEKINILSALDLDQSIQANNRFSENSSMLLNDFEGEF